MTDYVPGSSAAWWTGLSSAQAAGMRSRSGAVPAAAWPGIPSMRSADSFRLEALVRAAGRDGLLAPLGDVALERHAGLMGWIAVIHPDVSTRRLTVMHAGPGLSAMQADPVTGTDYLELVDPAIKGDAFDSAVLMLSRRCGLWQMSPVRLADGSSDVFEFTGFPVFDEESGRGVVLFLIWHPNLSFQSVSLVGHARTWTWLDMRTGLAG